MDKISENMPHTPLPWRITEPGEKKDSWEIVGANGSTVAKLASLDLPNAQLIVEEVNKSIDTEYLPFDLNENESDPVKLWVEILRLHQMVKGSSGFKTWRDAAIAERLQRIEDKRVKVVDYKILSESLAKKVLHHCYGEFGTNEDMVSKIALIVEIELRNAIPEKQ